MSMLSDPEAEFKRLEGVFHEHGDGHGAHAARNRGNITGNLLGCIEVHVPSQYGHLLACLLVDLLPDAVQRSWAISDVVYDILYLPYPGF